MPIAECAGVHGCQRSISISAVPGGNPAANADPEGYAAQWTFCTSCKTYTCDRCLARQHGQCRCGAPARLYTEAERIQMAKGGPPPAPPAAPPSSIAQQARTPAASPASGVQVRMMLEGIGLQIDGDLGRSNGQRAGAMASLASTLMATQGLDAPESDVPWLLWYGESFYRWQLFAQGAEYWKGVFQLLRRLGKQDADEGLRAIATAGAFQVLSGEIGPSAPHAQQIVGLVQKVYGPGHILTNDVQAKLGPPPSAWPSSNSPGFGPPSQAVPLAPKPPSLPPELAALDSSTQLALWVTLAFLDIAVADGKIDEKEYLSWKQIMAKMQLPDVWERFGLQGLQRMLQTGVLHTLSAQFATLPADSRAKLAGVLVEFMVADGRVDPTEVQAVRRIGGWLGVTLEIG